MGAFTALMKSEPTYTGWAKRLGSYLRLLLDPGLFEAAQFERGREI